MKNKKAMVAKEVLNLVIAVLCLILLVYLAIQLYGIFTKSHELEQAKAVITALNGKVAVLKEGEKTQYLITSPKNWFIFYFESEKKLCACPKMRHSDSLEEVANTFETCNADGGICQIAGNMKLDSSCTEIYQKSGIGYTILQGIGISSSFVLNAYKANQCFYISNVVNNVYLEKKGDITHIYSDKTLPEYQTLDKLLEYKPKKDATMIILIRAYMSQVQKIPIIEGKISLSSNLEMERDNIAGYIKDFFEDQNVEFWKFYISDENNKIIYFGTEQTPKDDRELFWTGLATQNLDVDSEKYRISLGVGKKISSK